ncbi:MAG: cell division protein FtsH [Alphaproteobacteria bacterium CG_4_10_14_0_2_um_filter_63_37]|nr:MAG: cell division protein FtsH [Proteobacteria bacterium CG1_02_64_396]PJA25933.1 MAG: cell division protein FtsH [Alphaproteobacteria bacterium CG_4_10_14_0_2_um_filter_63_37]
MNNFYKNLSLWLVIGLVMIMLFNLFSKPVPGNKMIYSAFLSEVEKGNVVEVTIDGTKITGSLVDGRPFTTYAVEDPDLVKDLRDRHVSIASTPKEEPNLLVSVLVSWFPMILLIGIWIFFMRQVQGGGTKGAMSFGKSRAKLLNENSQKVTFADVAGVDEGKGELTEVVDFLKDPQKFTKLGAKIPKGVLLIGPPGTGKTLLARAVAGEAGVPFFSISGSDFVEMFVGVGASRVRDLFEQAKKQAPCLVFIDEIDAVGRRRGAGLGGGHDEREQTLNQLLVEMDGFESNEGVILIAATNRPDVLDPALLRPGRFDRQVTVPSPDVRGREQILKVHMGKVPIDDSVVPSVIARGTPGFSGADLANLVNEAALLAARQNKERVTMADFEAAKDKVLMGVERKSQVISERERATTAYHEAGHALVAIKLPGTDPIHKVSIIPRGRALGVTMQLPSEDRYTADIEKLENDIAIMMGGRLAEELVLNQKTTGASNDIMRATQLARRMVTEWGMSEALGPLTYGEKEEEIFLGREVTKHSNLSERTMQQIDGEIRTVIDRNYNRAREILKNDLDELHTLGRALLRYETIDAKEIAAILKGVGIRGESYIGDMDPDAFERTVPPSEEEAAEGGRPD